ncbi:MAG: tetratricopeptide repeat protein [Candidatus Hydrogenedentes bacterium]|nr:tetratricopeptide repeat protein [Candidatus Hydrogenedentota bacterium]
MAEIWDIARYVESNPDDHEQRWRLAKKLYTAWEYRLALEHLQILKNEGQKRLNILRYLAATYYRLGRYEEATKELRETIAVWPDEVGIYEQLARVLEIAGDHPGAAEMWDKTLELDPHHPVAAHAATRLRSSTPDTDKKKILP